MTRNVLSPHWTGGDRAAPIDPAAIRFKVAPAGVDQCVGCLFVNQLSPVCMAAAAICGIDCDVPLPDGRHVIYVLDRSDPRQLEIPEVAASGAASSVEQDAAPITKT